MYVSYLLGYAAYSRADWQQAQQNLRVCLEQSQQLLSPEQRAAADVVEKAQEMMRLTSQWQNQRFVCDPTEIVISLGADATVTAPLTRRFLVSAPRDVPLKVKGETGITAQVEESPWAADVRPKLFQKQIALNIAPELLRVGFAATITVSSPQLPGFLTEVSVRVEASQDEELQKKEEKP